MFDILTFYTDTHEVLFKRHFLPSLQLAVGHRLVVARLPQKGIGVYCETGWRESMMAKLDMLIEYCKRGHPFAYADCDLHWYRPTSELSAYMLDCDLATQHDGNNILCAGFMLVVNPAKVLPFFLSAYERMESAVNISSDQGVMNDLLQSPDWHEKMRIKLLPDEFWTFGLQNTKQNWEPKNQLIPPQNIFIHHANWTKGITNKILMLDLVYKQICRTRRRVQVKEKWTKILFKIPFIKNFVTGKI